MSLLELDIENYETSNNTQDPIHLGNFIAENYIEYGLEDGSMESLNYENQYYEPVTRRQVRPRHSARAPARV